MTREEAIKFLKEPRTWEWLNVAQQIAIDMAIEALKQELKTGCWKSELKEGLINNRIYRCSYCEKIAPYMSYFCPNCGADMRG